MTSRNDPFSSPKGRLRRAKEHIDRLDKKIGRFFKKEPYRQVTDLDDDGATQVHKLKLTKAIPTDWIHLATEAIEALRSALDQTGYAAAVLGGNASPKHAYFPIAQTAADFQNVVNGRCKDLPHEVVMLFSSFKAHQGGNIPLWTLNELRRAIHTTLVPVGAICGGFHDINISGSGFAMPAPRWDSEKNEIILFRVMAGGAINYNLRVSILIAFDQVDAAKNAPATHVLRTIEAEVRKVITETERTCRSSALLK